MVKLVLSIFVGLFAGYICFVASTAFIYTVSAATGPAEPVWLYAMGVLSIALTTIGGGFTAAGYTHKLLKRMGQKV